MTVQWTLRRRLGVLGLVAALVLVLAALVSLYVSRWHPSVEDFPLQGVDVSEQTGAIDWPMVRARGADFGYIRATAGAATRDARFAANWAAAHAAGLRRGAIHEYSMCEPAVAQANNFIVTVPRVSDALPAAVAIMDSPECETVPEREAMIGEIAAFARLVETHTGEPLILMISPTVEAKHDLSRALERPLWATGNYFPPTYLNRAWRIWRANDARRIEGAEQAVGWDVIAP